MASLINKARKPKFELHLTIYDLNNVPLVSGSSFVKWHLPYSMHGEHRGRTAKCPIDSQSHRVTYNYSKIVPLRISIDRNNNLTECPIEFEVLQEFPVISGNRDEKITLGQFSLNLSEYVEESESFPRQSRDMSSRGKRSLEQARGKILGPALGGHRRLSTPTNGTTNHLVPISTTTSNSATLVGSGAQSDNGIMEDDQAEEGIVRRYLMQESKINSTLKVSILMIQIDGDRNYVAPPLKTAPVFGGIAGFMTGEAVEPVDEVAISSGVVPSAPSSKKALTEMGEMQDMYRRALAASWSCQPGEMAADECIEDIFSGGDGWRDVQNSQNKKHHHSRRHRGRQGDHHADAGSSSNTSDEEPVGTLRSRHLRKMGSHMRQHSASSDLTVVGRNRSYEGRQSGHGYRNGLRRHYSREDTALSQGGIDGPPGLHSRSESMASLAPTLGGIGGDSERLDFRGREGFRRPREVDEFEVRDDLVSWALPGTIT